MLNSGRRLRRSHGQPSRHSLGWVFKTERFGIWIAAPGALFTPSAIEIASPLLYLIYLVSLKLSVQKVVNKGFRTSRFLPKAPVSPMTLFVKSLSMLVKVGPCRTSEARCASEFIEKLSSHCLFLSSLIGKFLNRIVNLATPWAAAELASEIICLSYVV